MIAVEAFSNQYGLLPHVGPSTVSSTIWNYDQSRSSLQDSYSCSCHKGQRLTRMEERALARTLHGPITMPLYPSTFSFSQGVHWSFKSAAVPIPSGITSFGRKKAVEEDQLGTWWSSPECSPRSSGSWSCHGSWRGCCNLKGSKAAFPRLNILLYRFSTKAVYMEQLHGTSLNKWFPVPSPPRAHSAGVAKETAAKGTEKVPCWGEG